MFKSVVLTVLLLGLNLFLSFAQTKHFTALNVKDGLSQSAVLGITQDNDGFMWFATRYGLNRYDGLRFKIYNHIPDDDYSLSDNYINTIYKDSAGKLWVATANGLNVYDAHLDHFDRIKFKSLKKSPVKINVKCLLEDHLGNIWVGTEDGLYMLRAGSVSKEISAIHEWTNLSTIIGNDILALYEDHKKTIWISSDKGLVNLTFNKGIAPVVNRATLHLKGLPQAIRSIEEDDQGNIWFGSESDGLYVLNLQNNKTEIFKQTGHKNALVHNAVRKIIKCRNGQLAIGTQGGLSMYDGKTKSFSNDVHRPEEKNSLSQNSIYSLFEDNQGSLWVGTYFGGVNIVDRNFSAFHNLFRENRAIQRQHQVIRAIFARNGGVWMGSEGGGVSFWNTNDNEVKHYYIGQDGSDLTTNLVKSILVDKTENVWIGTSGGGLKLIEKSEESIKHFNLGLDPYRVKRSAILSIYQDHDGLYWFGGLGYNRVYRKEQHMLIDVTPKNVRTVFDQQTIVSFCEGRNGEELWILTENRLYRYNFKQHSLHMVLEDQGGFNCLSLDHHGVVWLGKYYGGLIGYDTDKNQVAFRFTKETGLTNDHVMGIVEDKSYHLWISTQSGLNRLDPDRKLIKTFTSRDGIESDAFNFNAIYLDNQTLYLGSLNGLTYFNVKEIRENKLSDNLVFSGLRLFGGNLEQPIAKSKLLSRNIALQPHLEFANDQHIFTIEFALLRYIKHDKNRYAYQLKGITDKWTLTDKGEATFINLAAGDYTLVVKAQNNDGIWTPVKELHFTILPPIWKTWWAYLIYLGLCCFVIFIAIRYFYLQGLRKKDLELHQLKMNFFTNISHEIRSHLTLIMAPIENAIFHKKEPLVLESHLQQAKQSGNRLLGLVNELMDFRKAESKMLQLNKCNVLVTDLLHTIVEQSENLCKDRGIVFRYKNSATKVITALDTFQFEKVIFNLLSNALKYTPENGRISLLVDSKENHLCICIENTGKGIDPAYFDKIFQNYFQIEKRDQETGYGIGLALSQQIVQLHDGELRVESDAAYTRFIIQIPITTRAEAGQMKSPSAEISLIMDDPSLTEEFSFSIDQDYSAKILLVEDNPELLQLLVSLLQDAYELYTAKDGEEGLVLAETLLPDLVISDVMMPEKNGLELCSALKVNPITSHIPIILLTALIEEPDHISGLNSGADAYVTKPFNRNILLLHIRNLIVSRNKIQEKYRQEFVFGPRNIPISNMDEEFLSRFITIIEKGLDDGQFDVEHLVEKMAMSQSVLYKKVRALTGMTINEFSKSIRLKRAAALLEQKAYAVSEVALMVGFMDSKYFAKEFKKYFGVSPSQYTSSRNENKQ